MSLSAEQIQHFIDHGFIHLSDCFDTSFAARWTSQAFDRIGYDEHDRATWQEPIIHMPNTESVSVKDFAPKVWAAMCDLLGGEERIQTPVQWGNGFIVNFHLGADREWVPPSPEAKGWHKDGDFFWHFLDSPEQGLLVIVVWRDIDSHGGGTFIAPDSVQPIARYLHEHPEGLHPFEGGFGDKIVECSDLREVTGKAGDVILMHPYMLHASSQNHSDKARFITNPPVALKEPMNFNRTDPAEFSPVERAILQALGVERMDFQIQGERRPFDRVAYREARAKEQANGQANGQ